mmetsp:Transcript_13928/g.29324  ORF Transcript_13928/g.29324 Transcript_13928/m.29324 type:complete len:251 (-) Transcript_13928:1101-1853(-)
MSLFKKISEIVIDVIINVVIVIVFDFKTLESGKGSASLLQSTFEIVQSTNLGPAQFLESRVICYINHAIAAWSNIRSRTLKDTKLGVEWLCYGGSSRCRRRWVKVDVSWYLDGERSQKKAHRIFAPIDIDHSLVFGFPSRKAFVEANAPRQRFFQVEIHGTSERFSRINHLSDFFFEIPHPSIGNFLHSWVPSPKSAARWFGRRRRRRRSRRRGWCLSKSFSCSSFVWRRRNICWFSDHRVSKPDPIGHL